jgi:hypothetical protein
MINTPNALMRERMETLESKRCEVIFSFNAIRNCKSCYVKQKFTGSVLASGDGYDDVSAFNNAYAVLNLEEVEKQASPVSVENASLLDKIKELESKLAAAQAAVPRTAASSNPSRLGMRGSGT